jgi:hypothetical protein
MGFPEGQGSFLARFPRRAVVLAVGFAILTVLSAVMLSRGSTRPTITEMEVELYRGDHGRLLKLGRLGRNAASAQVQDHLRVAVTLSQPAYAYLLAVNPDGAIQFCLPEDDAEPPSRTARLTLYPDTSTFFTLNEGAGLQAFVVLVSHSPLPAYGDWYSQQIGTTWSQARAAGVWRFDGNHFTSMVPAGASTGPGRDERVAALAPGRAPEPFEEACRAFRHLPDVDAIAAICFPVRPAL